MLLAEDLIRQMKTVFDHTEHCFCTLQRCHCRRQRRLLSETPLLAHVSDTGPVNDPGAVIPVIRCYGEARIGGVIEQPP